MKDKHSFWYSNFQKGFKFKNSKKLRCLVNEGKEGLIW
jgi:hypothetical protein